MIGSPAEECGGGGKLRLMEHQVFRDMDLAMMSHPFPITNSRPVKFALER